MVKINANKELHSSIMIIEECYVTRLFFDRKYITILLNGSVSGNTKEFQFQDLDYDFVWFTCFYLAMLYHCAIIISQWRSKVTCILYFNDRMGIKWRTLHWFFFQNNLRL